MIDHSTLLFIGDSLTERGRWDAWFPTATIHNLGVGGNTTDDVLNRLDEAIDVQPHTVVLLIGANDLAKRNTVEHTVRNIETILVRLRQELPDSEILVQSVMPRERDYAEDIREINRHVWQFASTVRAHFLDLWPALATQDGELRGEYTSDGLHLTDAGYEAWLSELEPALERIYNLPPKSRPIRLPELGKNS